MHRTAWALLALLLPASEAVARAPVIRGEYDSPLGRVRITGDGTRFTGRLVAPSAACPFARGEEVLRGTLLDDSLAGQLRVCLSGDGCEAKEEWASAVLLATGERLAGAAHVATPGCAAPLGKQGGVTLAKVREGRAPPYAPGAPAACAPSPRERARALLRDGAGHLAEGNFEAARRRFLEATEADPTVPEAYNGVGVTYRMRNDLREALAWYKRALAVDPDFGDAYYNIACVYALRGKKDLALRYLQIAALNGYATAEGMGTDPDLETLRGERAYRALVGARM